MLRFCALVGQNHDQSTMFQFPEHQDEPYQSATRAASQNLLLPATFFHCSSGTNMLSTQTWHQSFRHIFNLMHLYRGVSSPSSGIWAARARKVDKAKSYNFVTRALANVREKNVRDQKVFKVNKATWNCVLC